MQYLKIGNMIRIAPFYTLLIIFMINLMVFWNQGYRESIMSLKNLDHVETLELYVSDMSMFQDKGSYYLTLVG